MFFIFQWRKLSAGITFQETTDAVACCRTNAEMRATLSVLSGRWRESLAMAK